MATPGLDLRDGVRGLVDLASTDLSLLWSQVRDAAEADTALRDVLPALIDTYGAAAGTLAADWYDDLRGKVGVGGSFTAIPVDMKGTGSHALINWAVAEATDLDSLQTLVLGGTQRRIANFSRLTVAGSSVADPKADGWQRVGTGGCKSGFCDMLISRGTVYSEAAADFAAHDHCNCSAVPAFGGEARPVRAYKPSAKFKTLEARAENNKRLREHLSNRR